MEDFIILDQEKHSGFCKATRLEKSMEIRAIDRLTPSAKTLLLYAVFFHQHYKIPLPSGRKFRKVLGWSDATFYRAIDNLLHANAFKAVGEGSTRKVFVNPRLLNHESEEDQIKFFRILTKWQEAGTTDVPVKEDMFSNVSTVPSKEAGAPKKTRRPDVTQLRKKKHVETPPLSPAEEPDWLMDAPFED
jgi:hypothetical protein